MAGGGGGTNRGLIAEAGMIAASMMNGFSRGIGFVRHFRHNQPHACNDITKMLINASTRKVRTSAKKRANVLGGRCLAESNAAMTGVTALRRPGPD